MKKNYVDFDKRLANEMFNASKGFCQIVKIECISIELVDRCTNLYQEYSDFNISLIRNSVRNVAEHKNLLDNKVSDQWILIDQEELRS